MSVYKRGPYYHYDFVIAGKRYRGPTYQTTKNLAEQEQSKTMTDAREGRLGVRKPPTLEKYAKEFLQEVEASRLDKDTKRYYANGVRLLTRTAIKNKNLNQITEQVSIDGGPASQNCAIRTLRRILNKARKEGYIQQVPTLPLAEDRHRETIIPPKVANKILAMAGQPLRDVFMVLYDTGMRPEEVYRMETRCIDWGNKTYFVEYGKTKNSRRVVPLSERVYDMLVVRCADKKARKSGWVFPARNKQSRSGYVSNVAKQWCSCRTVLRLPPETVLYSARHTFGTRVYGATGNLKLTMKAMGHGDTKTALRYQHPEVVETVRGIVNQKSSNQKARVM